MTHGPRFVPCAVLALGALGAPLAAQQLDPGLYAQLHWRMIGPFRAGRTVAASGVPGRPNVFYVAANNGGVWKTDDYGHTWMPIFDDQPTGSIGALAVAPSNPDVVYVGSGEGLQRPDLSTGDGVYKSTDGGRTWEHLGLRDAQQIGAIIVDPRDPNRVLVAALGHPYGANAERGVFRSTDGGKTFDKVLYKDENTGAVALAFDPTNPQVVYADLWESRQAPWENGVFQGSGSGLYKSADGGTTWRQLTQGLSTFEQGGLGRIGFTIAPSDPRRMYAMVDASPQLGGVYRSDDAGESWRRVNGEPRVWGRGSDFAEAKVDPRNPDVVWVANTTTYRSTDGGAHFTAVKGAPGGDDYHTIWINPENPDIVLLASDQGATLSVNGGRTWSSWYNQPTAQFYHVSTDNQWPYWVYGGQQESGSVGIASRGGDGQITFRDWRPVGAEEYAYIAADPLDANIIYGSKATRFDRRTGQSQDISPAPLRTGRYRFLRTMPILFSPVDPHILYLASNVLFKTADGGHSWTVISPDLTRTDSVVPASVGVYADRPEARARHPGVIYAVAPSPLRVNLIWAGTDDGLIHVTHDGGLHWRNVTPPTPELGPWSKIAQLEASHFDTNTAYAAVNTLRLDDPRPHVYRTRDGGRTWRQVTTGMPDGGIVNTVREDPVRKGLLFAGTEQAVYLSFDDGDHWQSLRLNMPATSIRDLVIHENDVVVGTHGRSFWILDDFALLRELDDRTAAREAVLFQPAAAYRAHWNNNTDTPLPPEEPAGANPPDGAIIDYYLKTRSTGPVALEFTDSAGRLVRRFSSADQPVRDPDSALVVTPDWPRPPAVLPSAAGVHRFVWDLHYPPPAALRHTYPIAAIVRNTPREPRGPWVLPGRYTVKLTVGEVSTTAPLTVRMDPRVHVTTAALARQLALARRLVAALKDDSVALGELQALRRKLGDLRSRAQGDVRTALDSVDAQAAVLEQGPGGPPPRRVREATDFGLARLNADLVGLLDVIEGADAAPTTQATLAVRELERAVASHVSRWRALARQAAGLLAGGRP